MINATNALPAVSRTNLCSDFTDAMMVDVPKSQERMGGGEPPPAEELLPLVYQELRKIAAHKMAQEAPGQTLQPTALVHEAWLRLGADAQPAWKDRAYFFAAAAEAMRRILVERARRRTALKRGGGAERVGLDEVEIPLAAPDDERLLAVDEVLEQFAAINPRQAELVKLRYFAGMTFEEAASVLGHRRADGEAMVGLQPGLAGGGNAPGPLKSVSLPALRSCRLGREAKRMFEIHPYFFQLAACRTLAKIF
jgi:RNA polymerase sigma factor (TIGR02999 family)